MAGRKRMSDREFMEKTENLVYISNLSRQLEGLQDYLQKQRLPYIEELKDEFSRRGIKNPFGKHTIKDSASAGKLYGMDDKILITQEACDYLRISRPTYLKYIYEGRIKGTKAGKSWKVLKSELDRFLRGE
ncbi:MAG: helix-turn-helix domain-containing protein [Candidatus Aenigmarchaeota archaeon]|nr:helix-turn-helix domain-containing protein [Candidatus Aenigmarchaeota archaeon]